jgi:alpha-L-rhamnosidase
MGQAFYALDSHRGAMLARKGIRELVAWKKPDGVLYSPIPAGRPTTFGQVIAGKLEQDGTWDRELPMQMLASLGWYGFWTYYWYSGDAKTVVAAYPAVKRYLMLWSLNERGRVAHRAGGWDWPDWGQNADVPILDTAWYYLALKAAVEMARLSGEESDRAGYESQMARISAIFDSEFWQGSAYRTDAVEKGPDDRANALAVVAGLVPPERFEAVQRVLAESRFAGPYMEKYVLEALFLMGAPEAALDRMRHRYARMLADPITTLWENFGGGEDRTGRGTYNHSWSGGPLTLLSQYVAGVAPLDPGWARVSIAPQPGALEWVRCTVPTVRGGVGVEMKSSALGLSFKLTLPPGCDGEFFLPDPSEGKVWQVVQVGGKVLSEALDSLILEEGVHHIDCLW